jgi:HSP20 family protein
MNRTHSLGHTMRDGRRVIVQAWPDGCDLYDEDRKMSTEVASRARHGVTRPSKIAAPPSKIGTRKEDAMSVLRFDPFRDFDRLADQMYSAGARGGPRSIPVDAYRSGNQFVIHVDLPGVDPDAIELTVEQNVLTIRAERRDEPKEGDELLINERPQGTFSRQLLLGDSLDTDRLEAHCDQGVLTLLMPVGEAATPRRVQITKGSGEPASAEGQAARKSWLPHRSGS